MFSSRIFRRPGSRKKRGKTPAISWRSPPTSFPLNPSPKKFGFVGACAVHVHPEKKGGAWRRKPPPFVCPGGEPAWDACLPGRPYPLARQPMGLSRDKKKRKGRRGRGIRLTHSINAHRGRGKGGGAWRGAVTGFSQLATTRKKGELGGEIRFSLKKKMRQHTRAYVDPSLRRAGDPIRLLIPLSCGEEEGKGKKRKRGHACLVLRRCLASGGGGGRKFRSAHPRSPPPPSSAVCVATRIKTAREKDCACQ